jgi:hypothetical protein
VYLAHRFWDKHGAASERYERAKYKHSGVGDEIPDKNKILVFTDFSSRMSLLSKYMQTCESAPLATCCVAIVLHSPHWEEFEVYVQEGSESEVLRGSKGRYIDTKTSYGEGKKVKQKRLVYITDYWRAYSQATSLNLTLTLP